MVDKVVLMHVVVCNRGDAVYCLAAVSGDKISKAVSML